MEQPNPDSKDWTWVLERPCDDCGYDTATIDRDQLGALVRTNGATWRRLLGRGDLVSQRPPADDGQVVWSALEYGAHVRDVYRVFLDRLTEMLTEDDPTFVDWDQNEAAIVGDYADEDPGRVAYDLALTAGKVADTLDRVSADGWDRPGERSDGRRFTVESLARYLLHDANHHAADAEAGYEALTEDEE